MREAGQGATVACHRQCNDRARGGREGPADNDGAKRSGATAGERRMVPDGSAGKCETEGRRQERASGPRDVRPCSTDGSADGKSAGPRRNHGDASAANHLCANHRRDSCRGRRTIDRILDKRERSTTCCCAREYYGGRPAGEIEERESPVYRPRPLVSGAVGGGNGVGPGAVGGGGLVWQREKLR